MKRLNPLQVICFIFLLLSGATTVVADTVEPFPLADVRLLESPFLHAQNTNTAYLLQLDPDRLLAPYQREAGLPTKAETYGNWESSGLDGHIGGHYLTALALTYAATGDQTLLRRLNYTVTELKKAQDKNGNGYLGGIPDGDAAWKAVAKGQLKVDNFSLNDKWVPWYNLHKIYAGLRDAYIFAQNEDAKAMLIKLADWAVNLTEGLSDDQMELMLRSEYGGMNEIFVDVAEITGDKKYLAVARRFSHRLLLNPLIQERDELTGMHANTQIPKVIGFKRVADASNDETWNNAAQFFWETVVEKRTVAIGGNSVKEHFHSLNDFEPMIEDIEGPETCNTYNMLKLSKLFYESTGDLKYLDFYERGLYNHILSSQHPETGGLVYFTSMRPNHYRTYSQVQDAMWCCVGSGIENHAKYGELIYAHSGNNLYVNLFIPSTLNWREKNIQLTQTTPFPDADQSQITVQSKGRFVLNIRYPIWVAEKALTIHLNGKPVKVKAKPGEYVALNRSWRKGDQVTVSVPMTTRLESLPDQSDYYAVLHGPIVMAAKTQPFAGETLRYFADDSRMGHIASGKMCPLEAAPMFVTDQRDFLNDLQPVANKPLTFSVPVVQGKDEKRVELIPFFRLHDSRYMLYWPMTDREKLVESQQATAAAEREQLALESLTIDAVTPGQQQPESDHFLQSERSDMGVNLGRHWRHAEGWFSYVLTDKMHEAAALQITYFAGDSGRSFAISLNDTVIANVLLEKKSGDGFYTMDYPIPKDLVQAATDGKLVIKFTAEKGSIAGGIYGVRLMRAQLE